MRISWAFYPSPEQHSSGEDRQGSSTPHLRDHLHHSGPPLPLPAGNDGETASGNHWRRRTLRQRRFFQVSSCLIVLFMAVFVFVMCISFGLLVGAPWDAIIYIYLCFSLSQRPKQSDTDGWEFFQWWAKEGFFEWCGSWEDCWRLCELQGRCIESQLPAGCSDVELVNYGGEVLSELQLYL